MLLLVSLGWVWGTSVLLTRCIMAHPIHPVTYAFLMSLGSWGVLLCFERKLPGVTLLSKPRWFLLLSVLGLIVPNINFYTVTPHLPVGVQGIVLSMSPIFTYAIATLVREEGFSWIRLLGVAVSFLGLGVVRWQGWENSFSWGWLIVAMLTPLCYAACTVLISREKSGDPPRKVAIGMLEAALLILLPWILATVSLKDLIPVMLSMKASMAMNSVLAALGYCLFFYLIQRGGAVYYSLVDGLVMMVAMFWGRIVFDEILGKTQWLGVILIVLGIVLVHRKPRDIAYDR